MFTNNSIATKLDSGKRKRMTPLAERYKQVCARIRKAEQAYGRKPGSVQLLAVSKTRPAGDIALLYQSGQRHFAESYVQEALTKQRQLAHFDITWHFIGPIQSNKTRLIAGHFSWVHSVDRLKIARRLHEQRPDFLPPLNICLQVNISDENSKSGIRLEELPQLAAEVRSLQRVKLRGVMAIPAPQTDLQQQQQRQPYQRLREAVAASDMPELHEFSFGMSGDLAAAIAEGATMVRIGTALFGKRPPRT